MLTEDEARWDRLRSWLNDSPFYRFIGLRVTDLARGYAKLELPLNDNFHQIHGAVHGGVTASLADSCIGVALLTLANEGETSVTAEIKINYIAPIQKGTLIGEGRIAHKGRRLAVGDAEVRDGEGRLIAKALSTYAIVKKRG